ncbi:hypothetical protein GCM10023237_41070 [Streptomyces coeruleoprunus]
MRGGTLRIAPDVPPVAHLDDEDDEFTVFDLVGDPVAADLESVEPRRAGEFLDVGVLAVGRRRARSVRPGRAWRRAG